MITLYMGLRPEQAETYAGRAGPLLIIVSAPAVVYKNYETNTTQQRR